MVEASTHSAGTFAFRGTVLMCLYSLRSPGINDFRGCCHRDLEMQTQLDFFQIFVEILKSDHKNKLEVDDRLQWQSDTARRLRFQEPIVQLVLSIVWILSCSSFTALTSSPSSFIVYRLWISSNESKDFSTTVSSVQSYSNLQSLMA